MTKTNNVHLAIETSSRAGSIALGVVDADAPDEIVALGDQRRHAVGLMPAVDALFKKRGRAPRELGVVSLSIGPGSFTGLRIAVTIAKVLARTTGCQVVAVPTLDVVARRVATDPAAPDFEHLAVCLNAKRGQAYVGLFDDALTPVADAALMTPDDLLAAAPRPLTIVADKLPPCDWPADVTILPRELATPTADHVFTLAAGRIAAADFDDPETLAPLYVRRPEAEELWEKRNAKRHAGR